MAGQITERQYGDKIKLERQKQQAPLPRRAQQARPKPAPTAQQETPAGPVAVPLHTQRHLWGANYFLKKANEPRPSIQGVDEAQASIMFAANMAIQLAEATGDTDMAVLADEIMQTQDNPYDFYGAVAAAKMDDIEIAEGRFVDGTAGQPMEQSDELVQGNADNANNEQQAEKPKPESA